MKKILHYLTALCLYGVVLVGCENETDPDSDTKMENMKLIHLEKTVVPVHLLIHLKNIMKSNFFSNKLELFYADEVLDRDRYNPLNK